MEEAKVKEIAELASVEPEVVQAYLKLGITSKEDAQDIADEIQEAYVGTHASDKDFAQSMADELGIEIGTQWPYYCIDWEWAARELMYDYSEEDGYYFRNL